MRTHKILENMKKIIVASLIVVTLQTLIIMMLLSVKVTNVRENLDGSGHTVTIEQGSNEFEYHFKGE